MKILSIIILWALYGACWLWATSRQPTDILTWHGGEEKPIIVPTILWDNSQEINSDIEQNFSQEIFKLVFDIEEMKGK
jgi:hypothetical protein